MASISELLSIYQTTADLGEAENALDRIAAMEHPPDLELGECYDGLAEVAAEEDDYPLAVRAQRRALEHGCQFHDLAREMLGWYLLKAGEREGGEAGVFSGEGGGGGGGGGLFPRAPRGAPRRSRPARHARRRPRRFR